MDVRVKFNPVSAKPANANEVLSEILTGIPQANIVGLLDILSNRHPELAPMFKQAKETKAPKKKDLTVYVNNDPVAPTDLNRYFLRDGDTVSLFLKNP
ncbi:MAG: MoaD/ThiS family protein [Euryarchaeota archaeon]|nr:MoaD/ThiS family protein [Euryarchaeota archaeon]